MPARNRKDMPMKSKRGKIIFTGVIILAIVIAAFVYKQPVEIEDMYKDWDFDECTSILVMAESYKDNSFKPDKYEYMLEPGDEGFDEIINLVEKRKFIKSFKSLLPDDGVRHHSGDMSCRWELLFTIKEYGSIRLHNFFGQLDIGVEKPFKIISIDKNDPWLKEVFDTAVKYAQADEQKPAV